MLIIIALNWYYVKVFRVENAELFEKVFGVVFGLGDTPSGQESSCLDPTDAHVRLWVVLPASFFDLAAGRIALPDIQVNGNVDKAIKDGEHFNDVH
jgi:hypothetical protein